MDKEINLFYGHEESDVGFIGYEDRKRAFNEAQSTEGVEFTQEQKDMIRDSIKQFLPS